MDHAPEPWEIAGERDVSGFNCSPYLSGGDGSWIAGSSSDEGWFSADDPNYLRLVACVNSCRGIPTEVLNRIASERGRK
jgi:hypothetical protein